MTVRDQVIIYDTIGSFAIFGAIIPHSLSLNSMHAGSHSFQGAFVHFLNPLAHNYRSLNFCNESKQ